MKAAITGATGLLGGNLGIMLLEQGHEVVATRRATSRIDYLDEFDIAWREATLSDVDALTTAFEGADVVFHCAAAVSVQMKIEPWIYEANVTGTKNVVKAVEAAGVARLVHCSSVVAVGLSDDGTPCTEDNPWNMEKYGLDDAYAKTKHEAEQVAMAAAADGLDVVVVNPTYMIGAWDVRPSSGQLVVDIVKRKMPGRTPGTNNFVDVRDVARGMILAAEKGKAGERYILGGVDLTYGQFMDLVAAVAGTKPITRKVPGPVAKVVGLVGDLQSRVSSKEPLLNSATIRWAYTDRYIFSSAKAQADLGYEISPLEPAIQSAIDWWRARDML